MPLLVPTIFPTWTMLLITRSRMASPRATTAPAAEPSDLLRILVDNTDFGVYGLALVGILGTTDNLHPVGMDATLPTGNALRLMLAELLSLVLLPPGLAPLLLDVSVAIMIFEVVVCVGGIAEGEEIDRAML